MIERPSYDPRQDSAGDAFGCFSNGGRDFNAPFMSRRRARFGHAMLVTFRLNPHREL